MKSNSIIITLLFFVIILTDTISQEKLLPNVNNNPVWFKDGKIGVGTSDLNSDLDVYGKLGVLFGGHGYFYTNGLKHFNIIYNDRYPSGGTFTTSSRLEIGIDEGNNHYWFRAKQGYITFRIGGGFTSYGHILTQATMCKKNLVPRSYVELGGYSGYSGVVAHYNGRVSIGTNQKGGENDFFSYVKSRFSQNIYLDAGKGIYSLHNSNYLLKDHANGNVTLNAAGGNLYYLNTGKALLREPIYDSSVTYSILHPSRYINQSRTGVTNYYFRNVYLKEVISGSAKLHFKGYASDIASIYSEVHDGSTGTHLAPEVKDDTHDYVKFRHGHHSYGDLNLMDLRKNEATIYNPQGVGSSPQDGFMLTVDGAIFTKEIKVSITEADCADFVFDDVIS